MKRTEFTDSRLKEKFQRIDDNIAINSKNIYDNDKRIDSIDVELASFLVEYRPIKKVIYGLITLVMTSVLIGILALVIKNG